MLYLWLVKKKERQDKTGKRYFEAISRLFPETSENMNSSQNISFSQDEILKPNRLQYVLDFLEQHPLAKGLFEFCREPAEEQTVISIHYGSNVPNGFRGFSIPAQTLFFNEEVPSISTLLPNVYVFEQQQVFSVEQKIKAKQAFLHNQHFGFDILETLFFHLSRYEEWHCPTTGWDRWDMMQAEEQFLVKHQLHRQPVVDILVYVFLKALGLNPPYLPTRYCISHDIDEVQKFSNPWRLLRSAGGLLLKRQSLSSQVRLWRAYFDRTDPFDTFDWMLQSSEQIKQKLIYFLVGGQHRYDTPYDLENPRMQTVLKLCKDRGYTIGLHPSYESWREETLFRKEKAYLSGLIGSAIQDSRQHYLHFDFQQTPLILEQNKIVEDSSMGFNDRIGFRCGTGFPYHLYDFKEERPFRFLEKPLVLMDSALLAEGNYDPEKIQLLWDTFLQENSHLTQITFNFHNSRFFDAWVHRIPLKTMYENLFRNTP